VDVRTFLISCAAVLLPATLAAADVSGAWTGTIGGPIYLVLKQEGTQLSGSGGGTAEEQIATFKDGRVDGDHLTFRVGPYQFDVNVQGDRITGEARNGAESAKVFLRRVDSLPKRAAGAPLPAFEVASVKPAPPPIGGYSSSMNVSPGRLTATNVSIRKLMARAYNVKDYQVLGADWLNTALYTITASMPPDTTGEDLLLMVQQLLAERFQLAFHRETRDMPVYELVSGKTGAKLKSVDFGKGSTSFSPGKLTATAVPLRNFVEVLSRYLNRPVLDKTGLTGTFDFTLEFSPDGKGSDDAGELPVGASLFTAIQEQLGLKLEARKAPIEVLVVDRAERVPTGN
jgi:uncharacterized protein (TIGR03435 family)